MKNSFWKISLLALSILAGGFANAQEKSPAVVKEMLESKNFIFKAQFANPQAGSSLALTSAYDLTIRPDSIISFLPYFGRAFVAPINLSEGGIKFTSTQFNYTSEQNKKGKWTVAIKPKDASDVQQLFLTIYDNGNATLSVTSTNRQFISFNGYVEKGREINKKAF